MELVLKGVGMDRAGLEQFLLVIHCLWGGKNIQIIQGHLIFFRISLPVLIYGYVEASDHLYSVDLRLLLREVAGKATL